MKKPAAQRKPAKDLLPREIRRSLPIALLRAREAIMAHFRPMLAAHGLTEQQWRVLRILAENETCDASEMAERAAILAPSLTRILASLERRRLIRRARDRTDRRRSHLSLTPAGVALIGAVSPDSRRIYALIEQRFDRRRSETLLALLEELAAVKP